MSNKVDDKVIGGIVLILCLVILWSTMIGILWYRPNSLQGWISNWLNYWYLPKSKAGLTTFVLSIVLIISIVVLLLLGINDTPINKGIDTGSTTITNAIVNGTENFGTDDSTSTYKAIGYGPVIDKTKVRNWINATSGIDGVTLKADQTTWLDGNGVPIPIPKEQFKALYGYIPPSFAYFPKGQTKNDYNYDNYKKGRENCMKACSLTNCTAVQTEVPQNCSQKANITNTGNSCGSNSEFSCTLFYDNIKKADDAYWELGKFSTGSGLTNSPGCFEAVGVSCLGRKYYEDNPIPTELPNNSVKPSQNPVTFCDSNVTQANNCVKRPLLTTEYVQSNFPYYQLPANAAKASSAVSGTGDYSMVVPTKFYRNGTGTACGVVNGKLKSCETNQVCAQGEAALPTSNCWQVDVSSCSGDPYSESGGATQLQTYKDKYNNVTPPGSNYDDLYPSCYYRQKMTLVTPIQFNCSPNTVQIGCWGSPPVLYTDSVTNKGSIAACSDTSVIPSSERCQNGSDLASCTGFPHSCGTNNGTNTLWVRS